MSRSSARPPSFPASGRRSPPFTRLANGKLPLDEARRILDAANEPKRLWTVRASNHRFSGNQGEFDQRLMEAIAWVRTNATHEVHGA